MIGVRHRRGTTAVEFAVSIGLVLMLAFTVIDLGLVYVAQQTLNYGVETASRYAVVNSASANAGSVTTHFVSAVTPALGAPQAARCKLAVSFVPASQPGGSVTVQATLAWQPLGFDFMPAVTLRSSQTLVIQH